MTDTKDLVERLWAHHADPTSRDWDGRTCGEAADEIQRLQVELAYMEDIARCRGEENERLRGVSDAPLGPAPCGCGRFVMIRPQRGCAEHSDRTDLSW